MRPPLLTLLGVCFAAIGGFTMLDLLLNLALAHRAAPLMLGYATLDFLLAYALLTMQRWVLWALAANWIGYTGIVSLTAAHGSYSPVAAAGFIVNSAILFAAAYYHAKFNKRNWYAGAAFGVLWAGTMGYTIYTFL